MWTIAVPVWELSSAVSVYDIPTVSCASQESVKEASSPV